MKFNYGFTPANILFLFSLGVFVYHKTNLVPPSDQVAAGYFFFYSVLLLIGDFFLQWFVESYHKVLVIEIIGIAAIVIGIL